MKTLNSHLLTATFTLAALTGSSLAGTINWGGAFYTSNYNASGTDLQSGPTAEVASGEVMYELGIFQNVDGSEFIPTFANASEWNDRWVNLNQSGSSATSAYVGLDDNDEVVNYFGGIAAVGASGDQIQTVSSSGSGGTVVYGFQAYIWGYDTKDISNGARPEWFLVTGKDGGASGATTNNWLVPDSNASNNGTLDIQWDINSASVAIVGRIDDNIGSGHMLNPSGSLEHSDHQFATVPEPSSVLLTLLASLSLLRRKR